MEDGESNRPVKKQYVPAPETMYSILSESQQKEVEEKKKELELKALAAEPFDYTGLISLAAGVFFSCSILWLLFKYYLK